MIKVIFQHNDEELGAAMLDVLPQNSDLIHLERHNDYIRYIVLNRVWIFSKKEEPYVKIELAKR